MELLFDPSPPAFPRLSLAEVLATLSKCGHCSKQQKKRRGRKVSPETKRILQLVALGKSQRQTALILIEEEKARLRSKFISEGYQREKARLKAERIKGDALDTTIRQVQDAVRGERRRKSKEPDYSQFVFDIY
ncbi:MAG: hypothetical protein AB7F88_07185 [Pyrinomonadaceae bacterium]